MEATFEKTSLPPTGLGPNRRTVCRVSSCIRHADVRPDTLREHHLG